MRVVHFILDHRVGGPHIYVSLLRQALDGRVSSQLVTAGRGPMTDVALLNLRRFSAWLYPLELVLNALAIVFRFGLVQRPDVFHVHGMANLAPLMAAVIVRIPVAWHLHETSARLRSLAVLGAWLVRMCTHRVMSVADESALALPGIRAQRVSGMVDASFWKRAHAAPVATNEPPRLVALANLNPLKGIDILLAALELVDRPLSLAIIGAELDSQRQHARELHDRARVLRERRPDLRIEFTGTLDRDGVHSRFAAADFFTLPSRSEGCPLALLEAMCMELPCVATDVGAVREMLPPEQSALICRAEAPAELAARLNLALALDPAERGRLGAANRQAAAARYSIQHGAELVLANYRALAPASAGTALT